MGAVWARLVGSEPDTIPYERRHGCGMWTVDARLVQRSFADEYDFGCGLKAGRCCQLLAGMARLDATPVLVLLYKRAEGCCTISIVDPAKESAAVEAAPGYAVGF